MALGFVSGPIIEKGVEKIGKVFKRNKTKGNTIEVIDGTGENTYKSQSANNKKVKLPNLNDSSVSKDMSKHSREAYNKIIHRDPKELNEDIIKGSINNIYSIGESVLSNDSKFMVRQFTYNIKQIREGGPVGPYYIEQLHLKDVDDYHKILKFYDNNASKVGNTRFKDPKLKTPQDKVVEKKEQEIRKTLIEESERFEKKFSPLVEKVKKEYQTKANQGLKLNYLSKKTNYNMDV